MSRVTLPDGPRVLVTRPAERTGELVNAIAALGGEATLFPVLDIRLEPTPDLLVPEGRPLDENALLIFVSVYAVRALEAALELGAPLPTEATVAAIGPATAGAATAVDTARVRAAKVFLMRLVLVREIGWDQISDWVAQA